MITFSRSTLQIALSFWIWLWWSHFVAIITDNLMPSLLICFFSSFWWSTLNCHSVSGHLSSSHHRDSNILSSKSCLWLLFLLWSLCVLYVFQQVFVIAQILSHNFIISGIGSMRFLGLEFLVLFPYVFCPHHCDYDDIYDFDHHCDCDDHPLLTLLLSSPFC